VQATRAQAHLIDDLLDISRIVSGKMQLAVRPIRLGVFWNLLSNAVKFTPRGGRIAISVTSDGDSARVVVRDTGEGIDAELLPYIFDRFRQGESGASRKFGGLGLGLSIARNLVELHGGTLTAVSAGRGHGAEFTVLLPIGTAGGDVASARAADAAPRPLDGVSLLLVEDDPSTQAMLQMALRRFGASVTTAGTAEEALGTLRAARFDVVVSDIGLPGQDGCALLQRIRASGDDTPAIALTAYASPTERERALAAGFRSWLAKPVDLDTLAAEILGTIT
jgi:CheY-like chemotaxis protein